MNGQLEKALAKEVKRRERRKRLMANKTFRAMESMTRYMDNYYLDALLGVIPGWGDAIAVLSAIPFIYFSVCVIKSLPLTLAIINNALRDMLMGMIPFFVGDVIDVFHRSNTKNMAMVRGFLDGDKETIDVVNRRARQSVVVLVLLLVLIALMAWLLFSFGTYLYSMAVALLQDA